MGKLYVESDEVDHVVDTLRDCPAHHLSRMVKRVAAEPFAILRREGLVSGPIGRWLDRDALRELFQVRDNVKGLPRLAADVLARLAIVAADSRGGFAMHELERSLNTFVTYRDRLEARRIRDGRTRGGAETGRQRQSLLGEKQPRKSVLTRQRDERIRRSFQDWVSEGHHPRNFAGRKADLPGYPSASQIRRILAKKKNAHRSLASY